MTQGIQPASGVVESIVQEIIIQAPAARIFTALTDPAQLLEWWFIEGKFRATHAACDPRPGGVWSMRVQGSCGEASCTVVTGRYVEVDPPHRLSFTWLREEEDYPESLVLWELEEMGSETLVRVTHSGLISEEMRNRNNGWPLIQPLLKAFVEIDA